MSGAITGTFTGTGNSATVMPAYTGYNVSIAGSFTATVQVQRSFDAGSTWFAVDSFTAPTERYGDEFERQVLIRLSCTAYTTGTVTYRLAITDIKG